MTTLMQQYSKSIIMDIKSKGLPSEWGQLEAVASRRAMCAAGEEAMAKCEYDLAEAKGGVVSRPFPRDSSSPQHIIVGSEGVPRIG